MVQAQRTDTNHTRTVLKVCRARDRSNFDLAAFGPFHVSPDPEVCFCDCEVISHSLSPASARLLLVPVVLSLPLRNWRPKALLPRTTRVVPGPRKQRESKPPRTVLPLESQTVPQVGLTLPMLRGAPCFRGMRWCGTVPLMTG